MGEVRAGTEQSTMGGLVALRDRLAEALVAGGVSRHQVPALAARLVKTLEAIEEVRVGSFRRPGSRRGSASFSRPRPIEEDPEAIGPVPDDLREAVRAGFRSGLVAVRRLLSDLLDVPNLAARIVAPAARTLADVIGKLDALPDPDETTTKLDELRAFRAARIAEDHGQEGDQ